MQNSPRHVFLPKVQTLTREIKPEFTNIIQTEQDNTNVELYSYLFIPIYINFTVEKWNLTLSDQCCLSIV